MPTNIIYRGYIIIEDWNVLTSPPVKTFKVELTGNTYYDLATAKNAIDQLINSGAAKPGPDGSPFSPDYNNWTGFLEAPDVARENKLVALGPAPPGISGQVEGLVLLLAIKELGKTPEGHKILRDIAVKYLQTIGSVIGNLSLSSSANPYNCLINDYVCIRIYQRLGIISAHDAVQTAAWIDHVMGEMLKKNYFSDSLTGLTSMVTGLERQIPTLLGK